MSFEAVYCINQLKAVRFEKPVYVAHDGLLEFEFNCEIDFCY